MKENMFVNKVANPPSEKDFLTIFVDKVIARSRRSEVSHGSSLRSMAVLVGGAK